ncbi:nitronate monooxygenase [Priestia filamentosa]|uniref:NAD(P)H-dependent flavin oxidoreductase n=1 Tax=Priestia filamentosa TaxID=1402861 RepID=UPI001FB52B3D|nr:nitronate monooxygenase family protein [Priestia filamentosa]MED3728769.1 nitronate monooxygenase family protein [Priestia filamentosa]UOE58526.1 nitronate monooxygenase [Priestia filamentosa]
MNLYNRVCEVLNIEVPIIQAGMAGDRITTVELIVNVCEAGGLGTLGAAYMRPEDIRQTVQEIRKHTDKTFAVNLFATDMIDNTVGMEEVQHMLDAMRDILHIKRSDQEIKTQNLFKNQFKVLMEEQVPVVSTAFGILPSYAMKIAKEQGMKVITMVTTVREALEAQEQGADIIVAQGSEAGGHRGTFDMNEHPDGANIGLFSLIPQVVDRVNIPVVASGGIMDGRGLIAALTLGASGIQMGTAFLATKESGTHPCYKQALYDSDEESTVITKNFSGRPARGIKNAFIKEFDHSKIQPLAFPTQNAVTGDIRKAAAKQNNKEYMSLWCGQGTRLLEKDKTATEIINTTMQQAKSILTTFNYS